MTFTESNLGLRDREFAKFYGGLGTGSETSVKVVLCGVSGGDIYPIICTSGTNGGFLLTSGIN